MDLSNRKNVRSPALIAALKDEHSDGRELAAKALGRLGDKRAVGPLKALLKDENRHVRGAAETALKKLGHKPKPKG